EESAARPHLAFGGRDDPSDDRDLFTQRELGDGGQFTAFDVAAWEIVQRVTGGGQPELFGQFLGGCFTAKGPKRLVARIHSLSSSVMASALGLQAGSSELLMCSGVMARFSVSPSGRMSFMASSGSVTWT